MSVAIARNAAKIDFYTAHNNEVAAGLAEECEVQLSYAIGVAEPTSVRVDTMGTGTVDEPVIEAAVMEHFDLTPSGIISSLDLLKPIYQATAAHGHFGREPGSGGPGTFTWEKTDKAQALKASCDQAASCAS